MDENKRKQHIRVLTKIVTGVFSVFLVFILVVGLVFIIFYKSGESSLKASSTSVTPIIESTDEDEKLKDKYIYGDIAEWSDDWVIYKDKIYTYNDETLNFVLMGIDKKGEISSEEDFSDEGPGQADVIFLISLNPKDKKVNVIGIPRNSMVEIEIFDEEKQSIDTIYNQICLQYSYAGGGDFGLDKMEEIVSRMFYQLPIHGGCAVSYNAVSDIVDMLGEIDVVVSDDMSELDSSYVEGNIISLDGENVMDYLRYRVEAELGSPTTRLTRQKEFMKVAINVAISRIKNNPTIISDMYKTVVPYMNTDIGLDEVVYLARKAIGYSVTNDSFYQLTGEDKKVDFINDDGEQDFYDDYYLDGDALKDILIKVFYNEVVIE